MSIVIKKESAKGDLIKEKVEGDVTIYTVSELKEKLVHDLQEVSLVEVNFEKIAKFDTSGYQLMLMLKKEAESMNKEFKITGASEEVQRLYTLYHQEI